MNRRQFLKYAALGSLALAGGYPVFIERYLVQVNRYRIPVPNLPEEFDGFTVVQLTDLHYGFLVSRSFLEGVIGEVKGLGKDIVVCTGDYVHERNATGQIDAVWPLLGGLRAPGGVYSVLGNHDHWADSDRSSHWLKRSGQDLRGKRKIIERGNARLWLCGGGDLWEDHMNLDHLLQGIPEDECRIVLAHNPDSADTNFHERIDLMISGHTHGGQVNIPFYGTPILPVENKNYSSGLKYSKKNHSVYISRGIGWAIYPVRFNCFPEISVLELRTLV